MKIEDIVIIGAGPAGIAAAIQLKRYGLNPVLFEIDRVGGLLKNANFVENYPGFPDGLTGIEFIDRLQNHLVKYIDVSFDEVQSVDYKDDLFLVTTLERDIHARIVVVATGTKPKSYTDIDIPDSLKDKIHYEVYPILNSYGKIIAIIGAGDAAYDYGLNLSRNNDIIIINRKNKSNCLPLLAERAAKSSRIKIFENTKAIKIETGNNDRILLNCENPDGNINIEVDYLIPALGRDPDLDIVSDNLSGKTDKLIKAGIFYFIGDVKNGIYRQSSISIGDGIKAAMKIYEKLKDKNR